MITATEIFFTFLFFLWVIFVTRKLTKKMYAFMTKRGVKHVQSIYYNRKLTHILTAGLISILIPFIYRTPILPFIMALLLGILNYIPHIEGKIMYWLQEKDNKYEVTFCIMWGIIILLGWMVTNGNFLFGIIPTLYMSIGDAITGFIRNIIFKKRLKSWWGNVSMAFFSIPVGATLGIAGIISGSLASFIEHFDFPYIDDNISIPLISFIPLVLAYLFTPSLLII